MQPPSSSLRRILGPRYANKPYLAEVASTIFFASPRLPERLASGIRAATFEATLTRQATNGVSTWGRGITSRPEKMTTTGRWSPLAMRGSGWSCSSFYLAFYAGFVLIAAFAASCDGRAPLGRSQPGDLVWLRPDRRGASWWPWSIAGCAARGRGHDLYRPATLAVAVFGLFVALTLGPELLFRRPARARPRAISRPAGRFPGSSTAWPSPATICRPRRSWASAA